MGSSQSSSSKSLQASAKETSVRDENKNAFFTPTGREYDKIDNLAASLNKVIDEKSRAEVDEYIRSCDGGRGPATACHATAEYLSNFEQNHKEAASLYENACTRIPKTKLADRFTQGCEDMKDGTVGYPPSCFNLAKFRMTGRAGTLFSHAEGYKYFERACKGKHPGGCLFLAKMLASPPNSFEGVPHDPKRAMDLYQYSCDEGDSVACFTLAGMLLKGSQVASTAERVSPQEAKGEIEFAHEQGESDRRRKDNEKTTIITRDPPRAARLLSEACERGHGTSCYNLAVMYFHGDDGVPKDMQKHEKYKKKTKEFTEMFDGIPL